MVVLANFVSSRECFVRETTPDDFKFADFLFSSCVLIAQIVEFLLQVFSHVISVDASIAVAFNLFDILVSFRNELSDSK